MSSANRSKLCLATVVAPVSCLFGLLGVAIVLASPADIAAIKSRQDKLRDMGSNLKSVEDEIKKRSPDWDVVAPSADAVQSRASFLLTWFPKGTGPEAGGWTGVNGPSRTYALPLIWQKADDFTKLGKAMQAEAIKLNQLAKAKDVAGLRTQYEVVGKACKSCHDTYRSPDYEKDNPE
jgi:cytochrome c556